VVLHQRLLRAIYKEAREMMEFSRQTGSPLPPLAKAGLPTAATSQDSLVSQAVPSLQQAGKVICHAVANAKWMARIVDALGGNLDDDTLSWLAAAAKKRRDSAPSAVARGAEPTEADAKTPSTITALRHLSSQDQLENLAKADAAFADTKAELRALLDAYNMSFAHEEGTGELSSPSPSSTSAGSGAADSTGSDSEDSPPTERVCIEPHVSASREPHAPSKPSQPTQYIGVARSPLAQRKLKQSTVSPRDIDVNGAMVSPPMTPHPQSLKSVALSPSGIEVEIAMETSPVTPHPPAHKFRQGWRKLSVDASAIALPELPLGPRVPRGGQPKDTRLAKWRPDSPQSPGGWPTLDEVAADTNPWKLADSYIGELCPSEVRAQLEERLPGRPRMPLAQLPEVQISGPSRVGRMPPAAIKSPRSPAFQGLPEALSI
jgi:hypothetical protein